MPIALPVDEIVSMNELIRTRAREDPDFEVLGVPDKNFNITRYTFKQIDDAGTRLATYLVSAGLLPIRKKGDATTKHQVAFLAPSGFDYLIYEMALIRMGYCILFVSPNNSAPALAHLLTMTGSTHLIYHHTYADISKASIPLLAADHPGVALIPCPDPVIFTSSTTKSVPAWDYPLTMTEERDLPVFIVHSSGSTGFPKPIFLNHTKSMKNFASNLNMTGLTTLPLYHNHGHSCMYRAFCSKKILYLFPASTLPLTTANILGLWNAPGVEFDAIFGVPYAYKLLAEDPVGIRKMRTLKMALFGGSPMSKELGDRLVAEGIPLIGHIGSTEMGQIMTSKRDFESDKEWDWFRLGGKYGYPMAEDYIKFEPQVDGTYEMVILDGWPTKVLSNRPDGSYASSDCFIKHPTIPNAVKFIGRLDDTLVLFNGEKTAPVQIEGTLRSSPYVDEAIVFGAGRSQIGALIILAEGVTSEREEALKLLQPSFNASNKNSPSHSAISNDTVVLLPFGTLIPKADKGSFIRKRVYKQYENVIDSVYKRLEGEDGDEGAKKTLVRTVAQIEAYLANVIQGVVDGDTSKLTYSTDLFDYGFDSLVSTRVRNTVQRELDLKGNKLTINFVFDRPSITKMAEYLVALTSGDVSKLKTRSSEDLMLELVSKYSKFSAPSTSRRTIPSKGVVVLSGATGSLGAYTLSQLLEDPSVKTVYCLCRAQNDSEASARVTESLKRRRLSPFTGGRVVCLASDFSKDNLGLDKTKYEKISSHVSLIIHNAWSVNFNLDLSSFEANIRGTHNLIELALSVPTLPADFYFASSVSSVFAWPGPKDVPEEIMTSTSVAQNMGYAKSKWVTEKICEIATTTTQVNAGVLRIGQMVGDTVNGVWNETEAISLLFKTADTLHALPDLDDKPSWLPTDYAARTILEVVALPPPLNITTAPCWHIVQPNLFKWSDILNSFKKAGVKFDVVPRRQWVKLLSESDDDPVKNPTKKLLSFFQEKYDVDDTSFTKRYPLSTRKTQAASSALRSVTVADDALVAKWVGAWRNTGFLA